MSGDNHKINLGAGQPFFTEICKRDGRVVPFDTAKITTSLLKAGRATGEFSDDMARHLTISVVRQAQTIFTGSLPTVEGIQDVVQDVLQNSPFKKTATAYIIYREQHARIRGIVNKASIDLVNNYLQQRDWRVRENSNMAFSLQGLNNHVSSEIISSYWLNNIYTREVREAHSKGDLHLHDLAQFAPYCSGYSLYDWLCSGFQGAPGKVESRPARHFRTALGQIPNSVYTLQGEVAGAQALSHFDTLLATFIRYDNLSYKEVKQALQEFLHNMNVPTRVGFQTPFSNLTLDLQPPPMLAGQSVIIGGKERSEIYADFQHEMNMLNRALLEVFAEGDAKGRPFTFPILTYNITPDFDWDSPDLGPLWEVTAKYGSPNFANFVNSGMNPDDAWSFCCNLRSDLRELKKRGGGQFGAYPLTGSIGVVTINMPQIGFLAESESDFLHRLDELMEKARTSLETKRKVIERFMDRDLYPYLKFNLRHVKQRFGQYFHNHFSTVGVIGMNEACLNLFGEDIGTSGGIAFAARVLDHMREQLSKFQEETGNMYNLEATPAEGTTYRLARLDKKLYPDILCANDRDVVSGAKPFYTNSSHLPVNYTDDIFQVLDLQDKLQTKYTGGTVLHVFLGEAVADPQAVKSFVRKVCKNYRLPYFTITPTFSICPSHGYLRGEKPECPECGSETEVYSRVVGYLRPVKQWNEGKQAEFAMRSKYSIGGKSEDWRPTSV